jgi:fimbrial chaperone protein
MSRLLACLCAAFASLASAGDFGVSPIRVDLDRGTKSALVTVTNDDHKPLAFQVRVMEWTQDAAGADQYADSTDLVYFPRQLRIPPKESRVVRLGHKAPASNAEKAYRLFIEELADPERDPTRTGVAITLRFGVPVFVRPASVHLAGELNLTAAGGAPVALVRNTGTVHFRIATVRYAGIGHGGETLFEQSVDGWYVLAGSQRSYRLAPPPDLCAKAALLRAEAVAEKLVLRAERPFVPQDCP